MKHRVTYLLPESHRPDPSSIHVSNDTLTLSDASAAAEEWRLTLGWSELPREIQDLLAECHELRFRWSSYGTHPYNSPLAARLPAGLHAFFTPRAADATGLDFPICDLIYDLLGPGSTKCWSVAESWTRPAVLSERWASTPSYQYYSHPTGRQRLGEIFLKEACDGPANGLADCSSILDELQHADYVDVDFDAISHAVTMTAFWSSASASVSSRIAGRKERPIKKLRADDRIEVGVLAPELAKEAEQLSLGGYLTVIGENDHPGVTLFSFPARHHPLPSSHPTIYQAHFEEPTGLHPQLQITLPQKHLDPPRRTCSLHAYWTIPSALFIDRYQFPDPLFLASHNLIKLHSLAGEQDLEAPDWVISRWGSTALLQLATPPSSNQTSNPSNDQNWTITIPTHLRYTSTPQSPAVRSSHISLSVPWPILFWACEADEGLKMSTNPFDRINLGYDGLFGPKTMFYHIPPSPAEGGTTTLDMISVPFLDAARAEGMGVRAGTLAAVLVGFAWVCWQLLRGRSTVGEGKVGRVEEMKKKA